MPTLRERKRLGLPPELAPGSRYLAAGNLPLQQAVDRVFASAGNPSSSQRLAQYAEGWRCGPVKWFGRGAKLNSVPQTVLSLSPATIRLSRFGPYLSQKGPCPVGGKG